jgi:hypothetical protein
MSRRSPWLWLAGFLAYLRGNLRYQLVGGDTQRAG